MKRSKDTLKLIAIIALVAIVCFQALGVSAQHKQELEGISSQMSVTLSDLLWRYDPGLIEKTLKSSVLNYNLQGVTLYDAGLKEYHAAWISSDGVLYTRGDAALKIPGAKSHKITTKDLYHGDEKLGELILHLRPNEPKITLSEKEKAYLALHPVITVSNELNFPPYDFAVEGKPQGYSIELTQLVAEIIGVEVQFVNGYTWNELVELFKKGELDLLHTLRKTPERHSYGLFSDPYRRLKTHFVTQEDVKISEVKQLYGKTIAVGRGWSQEEYLRTNHPQVNLLRVDSVLEMLEAVSSGRAEATLGSGDVLQYVIKKHGMRYLAIGSWFKEIDNGVPFTHHFMAQKHAPELISMINKALASMSIEELDELEHKWFGKRITGQRQVQLNADEREWIKRNPRFVVGNELDWPPFDFAIKGEPQGYSIDYLNLLAKKLGIELEYANGYTWVELVEQFRNGDVDILPSLVRNEERDRFMAFTKPYLSLSQVLVTRKDSTLKKPSDLAGKKLAAIKGYALPKEIFAKYPEVIPHYVTSPLDALRSVATGEADGYADLLQTSSYLIQENYLINLHVAGPIERAQAVEQPLYMAVQPDKTMLATLLNKAMDAVSAEELKVIRDRWGQTQAQTVVSPLSLTPAEITFLSNNPRLVVLHNQDLPPYSFFEGDEHRGFWLDLLDLMFGGLGVELVHGRRDKSLSEYVNDLNSGEVDILTSVLALSSRRKMMLFSKPVVYINYPAIFSNSQDIPLSDLASLQDKRIALVKGHPFEVHLVKSGLDFEWVEVATLPEALEAVSYGLADATLLDKAMGNWLIREKNLTSVKPTGATRFPEMTDLTSTFAMAESNPVLQGLLNRLLSRIEPDTLNRLREKWLFQEQPLRDPELELTLLENDFLNRVNELTYCADPDWMPIERINKSGQHEGLTGDLMREVSKRLGVPLQLIPTKSWSQSMAFVREGRCQLLAAVTQTTSRQEDLDFTLPHGEYPLVAAVRTDELFIENLEAIRDKKLGMVKGYAYIDMIRARYPDLSIVEVENVSDGLSRVRNLEIFGYVDIVPAIGYAIRRQGLNDLKIGGKLDIDVNLTVGVAKGQPLELLSVLNKVLGSFSMEEKQLMADKWFSIKIERVTDYTRLWQGLGIAVIILSGIVYWNRKLVKLNRIVTSAHEEMERLSRTDQLTELPNRRHIDSIIQQEVLRFKRYGRPFSLVLIDIDHFKQVNDTYGHNVGDSVLAEFAKLLEEGIRKSDVVGRWGGEEFIILCPETKLDQAEELAILTRDRVAGFSFTKVGFKTASFGVASLDGSDSEMDLLKRADEALYLAKEGGRNRVCSA